MYYALCEFDAGGYNPRFILEKTNSNKSTCLLSLPAASNAAVVYKT